MSRPARRRSGALTTLIRRATLEQTAVACICVFVAAQVMPAFTSAVVAAFAVVLGWELIAPAVRRRRAGRRRGGVAGMVRRIMAARRPAEAQHRTTLDQFLACDPVQFEHAVAELARRSPGVTAASVHGGADDRGLDVLVELRDGRRVLVQCKRYAPGNPVGSDAVQIVNGTYRDAHRCDEAVIVTTSRFTRSAVELNGVFVWPIGLMDGEGLVAWANGGPPPWRRH